MGMLVNSCMKDLDRKRMSFSRKSGRRGRRRGKGMHSVNKLWRAVSMIAIKDKKGSNISD